MRLAIDIDQYGFDRRQLFRRCLCLRGETMFVAFRSPGQHRKPVLEPADTIDRRVDLAQRGHFVARIRWTERLGLGSVEDHFPFGERDFAGRWSMLLPPQASTGGKSG